MEDRIHREGNGDKLIALVETFEASNKNRNAQNVLYDGLIDLGASPEEANDFVSLFI